MAIKEQVKFIHKPEFIQNIINQDETVNSGLIDLWRGKMGSQELFSVTELQRMCEMSEYLDGKDIHMNDKTLFVLKISCSTLFFYIKVF